MALTSGQMPDITPPQIIGMAVAGIPILAELLRAFGIYDISLEQQQALSSAVTWAGVVGSALIGGDALLRVGRNLRKGQVEAALASFGEGSKLKIAEGSLIPGKTLDTVPPVDQGAAAFTETGFEDPDPAAPPPEPPPA